MKRLISAVILSAAVVLPTMAQKNSKTLSNGYPFAQVPFTSEDFAEHLLGCSFASCPESDDSFGFQQV